MRQGVRGYYNAPMPLVILWKLQEARCTLSDVMLAAAIYGVGRMRKTSDVRLDKQVKAVARLSKNTFLRSVDRLEAAKCFRFTRAPGRSIVAHIVWKSK